MKKTFILILMFSVCIIRSQTITQAANEPSIGDVDKNYTLDTSAYTTGLPNSVAGNNVTWDFTKVTGAFPIIFDSIVAPSAAAGGTAFPGASYAQKRGGINAFFTSGNNPSQTEWVGVYSPSLSITFTNSAIIATYPINFGYSSSDPVTGTFKYNTTNGVCNGSLTIVADGLGTLNLPNSVTFTNILRLHSVEELTMTAGFLPVGTINQTIFSYYAPGKKYPVMVAQYQKYQLLAGTPIITAMMYGNFNYFTVAGTEENNSVQNAEIYPNPFSDQLMFNNGSRQVMEFIFYNMNGKIISRTTTLEGFSTEQLLPGIYMLEIKTGSGNIYRKVVKE